MPYFHLGDIAKNINYDVKHVYQLLKGGKLNSIKYKNLLPINEGANSGTDLVGNNYIPNQKVLTNIINDSRTDNNAKFVDYETLKQILLEVRVDGANEYKEWLLKSSTIMRIIFRKILGIRQQLQNEKMHQLLNNKDKLLEDTNRQLNNKDKLLGDTIEQLNNKDRILEDTNRQLNTVRIQLDNLVKPKKSIANGKYVYIIGITKNDTKFRIGRTENPNRRLKEHQQSCLDNNFLHYAQCYDDELYEKIIHNILAKYRINDTEWFIVPYNVAKNIIDSVCFLLNKIIDNVNNHINLLDNLILSNNIKKLFNIDENVSNNNNDNDNVNNDNVNNNNDANNNYNDSNNDANNDANLENESEEIKYEFNEEEHLQIVNSIKYPIKPKDTYNDPEQFGQFIEERCIHDVNGFTEKQTLHSAYSIWCAAPVSTKIKNTFYEYMKSKYIVKSNYNEEINKNMEIYSGIKLKELEYISNNNELDIFIQEKLIFGPNYCISSNELFDLYKCWKKKYDLKNNTNTLILPKHKMNLIKFMKQRFFKGQFLGKRGYCGVGLFGNKMINKNGSQGTVVLKLDINTNEELFRWNSLTMCSKKLDINTSALSQEIIHNMNPDKKKIDRGGFYFYYENYVKKQRNMTKN